jgi:hypothetical protein
MASIAVSTIAVSARLNRRTRMTSIVTIVSAVTRAQRAGTAHCRHADGDRLPQFRSAVGSHGDLNALGTAVEEAAAKPDRPPAADREAHRVDPIGDTKAGPRSPGHRTREQQREARPRGWSHGERDRPGSGRDRDELCADGRSGVRRRDLCDVVGGVEDERSGPNRALEIAIADERGVGVRLAAARHRDSRARRARSTIRGGGWIRPRTRRAIGAADRSNDPADEQHKAARSSRTAARGAVGYGARRASGRQVVARPPRPVGLSARSSAHDGSMRRRRPMATCPGRA